MEQLFYDYDRRMFIARLLTAYSSKHYLSLESPHYAAWVYRQYNYIPLLSVLVGKFLLFFAPGTLLKPVFVACEAARDLFLF